MTEKWSFKNVAEFKEIFGTRECGNGSVARRNKILLECLKDKDFHKWLIESGELARLDWCKTTSMADLRRKAIFLLDIYGQDDTMMLMGNFYWSPDYRTDESDGLCEDGSYGHVRYVRKDNGRVFKMKAGKMFRHIIDCNEAGKHFPEPLKVWLCETFTERWKAYAESKMPKSTLRTDLSFADIYGNGNYECRDMGSCMNGNCQDSFYNDAVDATPAALVDNDGKTILARCVIFNRVYDETACKYVRLAERQYSRGGDESLKRQLVLNLINADLIDGYKAVGADCHNARAYVSKDEEDWSSHRFRINCDLEDGDTLSYQDSFKWYVELEHRAYNYSPYGGESNLETTDDTYQTCLNWDSWNECYTQNDLVDVRYDGRWYTCDECKLDDFILIDDVYYHYENVSCCDFCERDFLMDEGCYSELTGEHYCCESCRDKAEEQYKRDNWAYSDYDDEYVENVSFYYEWNVLKQRYDELFISKESLERLLESGEMLEFRGKYYLGFDAATRLPLDVIREIA